MWSLHTPKSGSTCSHGSCYSTCLLSPCHQPWGLGEPARHCGWFLRESHVVVGLAWSLEFLHQTLRCCCCFHSHCMTPHCHCRIPCTHCQSLHGWSPHLLICPHFPSPCHQNPHCQRSCCKCYSPGEPMSVHSPRKQNNCVAGGLAFGEWMHFLVPQSTNYHCSHSCFW